MNKQIFFTILYVALILGIIAFMIFMVFWLQSESYACMKNPIQYHVNKTAQTCYCNNGFGLFGE